MSLIYGKSKILITLTVLIVYRNVLLVVSLMAVIPVYVSNTWLLHLAG